MSQSIIESFIRDYGYWAILIGTFLEGETVVIIGGLFAHLGLLELPYVILSAFIGGFSGDQLYYFIGYFRGRELFARHPKWQNHADKALRRVEQYHNAIILGFRFVYGMRMIFPFVMGTWKKVRKTQLSYLTVPPPRYGRPQYQRAGIFSVMRLKTSSQTLENMSCMLQDLLF